MSKFINPFTDFGFKKIFGQEVSKTLLIDFLNVLLKGERVITDITFLDKESSPESIDERVAIYDIYCQTDTGEKIIVEMQNRMQVHFKDRALYYLANAIVHQAQKGKDWNYKIDAVYGVFFMNFSFAKENQKLRTDVILADRETGELFSNKLRQIFIALPLFTKTEEECENDFERWIFVLKNMDILDRMPFKAQMAVFKELERIAETRALTSDERHQYEYYLKTFRDYNATMAAQKEEGREEERIANARAFKSLGVSSETIQKATGLSKEEIDGL